MTSQETKSLIDEFDKLEMAKKDLDFKIEALKREIISRAAQENKSMLYGTHKLCSIKEYSKVVYPEDKIALTALLKQKGLYEQYSHINYPRLSAAIVKGAIERGISEQVTIQKEKRVSLVDRGI